MTLPTSLLPSGEIERIRAKATLFFTTLVEVYEITLTYNEYGVEMPASSLRFTASAYVGKISGKDEELLEFITRQMFSGTQTDAFITVLIPYGNTIELDNIVKNLETNKEYRVVWSNSDTSNAVQVYEKALCGRYDLLAEKRKV